MSAFGSVPGYGLNDGQVLPAIAFGTYPLRGKEAERAVLSALDAGYQMIDTAVNYQNEREVGRAIGRSSVAGEVQVTTKLPGRDHGYDKTIASCAGSRERLQRDVIDLYLIHWPNPSVDRFVDTWRAMIELRRRGWVRSIGVSNFTADHLERLTHETGIVPAVNQIEVHPYFPQYELRATHRDRGIVTQAWHPLGKNSPLLAEPALLEAASRHGVSPAQVALRWHLQIGTMPIPKSSDSGHQRENADLFGFELDGEDMAALAGLARRGRRLGGDPMSHEEM